MRPTHFFPENIANLLREQKIASLPELMMALGTDARRTVFRKLKELAYRTSYSHRGRYYTLDEIAQFDELGLWSCRDVWFSVYGTLLSTAAAMVEQAQSGFYADELDNLLHVGTKDALLKLVREARLAREKVGGKFLYCAAGSRRGREQLLARKALLADPWVTGSLPESEMMLDELRAAIVLFFSLLDEKQRRLYAGLEALRTGRGGDSRIAELLGLHPRTVAQGRRELLEHDVEVERVRRAGGGRKPVEEERQT